MLFIIELLLTSLCLIKIVVFYSYYIYLYCIIHYILFFVVPRCHHHHSSLSVRQRLLCWSDQTPPAVYTSSHLLPTASVHTQLLRISLDCILKSQCHGVILKKTSVCHKLIRRKLLRTGCSYICSITIQLANKKLR